MDSTPAAGGSRGGDALLRVLVVTKLFPNSAQPLHAPFNRQQYGQLGLLCEVNVLALIPWFPGARRFARWSAAGRLLDVPRFEWIEGLPVRHPRVLYLPRIGHALAPALFAPTVLKELLSFRHRIDVVLASWAYPEGVAAIAMARLLGIPVVMQVLGSDLNLIAERPGPRRLLEAALPHATGVIAVSKPLADKAVALGAPSDRTLVVDNGVDTSLFRPQDRAAARSALGYDGPAAGGRWILFVGAMVKTKGVLDLLQAFRQIEAERPDTTLVLVGAGAEEETCRRFAAERPGRVIVTGPQPHAEVARWMAACDLFTLPSWYEGTPNVVLEALASGRRVVSTRVGGIPDVVTSPGQGELVAARDPDALAAALRRGLDDPGDPAVIGAGRISWAESAARLRDALVSLVAASGRR